MSSRFGTQLFQLRLRRRRLQKQVALRAGIDPSYLAALERGRRPAPAPTLLQRLADSLDASDAERANLIRAAAADRLMTALANVEADLPSASLLIDFLRVLPALSAAERDAFSALAQAITHGRGETP
ncbi:helix-turn-helix transcriptional regulator [Thauera sp. 2A1]|uniref:helix-turn-helix domain-containing protein n=1 Tax=Thauera sp. 2A1 TaxID=2570191 RepID=UPI001290A568